jgi:lysophospholipase L1-like esterase
VLLFLFSFTFFQGEKLFVSEEETEINKLEYLNQNLKKILFKLKNKQKVEILHIGDSHVQIAEFSKGIINRLQEDNIKTQKAWFFPSLIFNEIHSNKELKKVKVNFRTENILNNPQLLAGITGRTFSSSENNFTIKFKFKAPLASFEVIQEAKRDYQLFCSKKAKISRKEIDSCEKIRVEFSRETHKFKLKFLKQDKENFDFYGFRGNFYEDTNSCFYSNFGVSGAKFSDFYAAKRFEAQLELLKPDLIFVTLGTNDSYYKDLDKNAFYDNLKDLIQKIKKTSSNTELILMTAPDTYYKNEKAPHLNFVNSQIEKVCKQEGVALWNWYKIMGGENSIQKWKTLGLVDNDLLHFSSKGYQLLGKLFAEALL